MWFEALPEVANFVPSEILEDYAPIAVRVMPESVQLVRGCADRPYGLRRVFLPKRGRNLPVVASQFMKVSPNNSRNSFSSA